MDQFGLLPRLVLGSQSKLIYYWKWVKQYNSSNLRMDRRVDPQLFFFLLVFIYKIYILYIYIYLYNIEKLLFLNIQKKLKVKKETKKDKGILEIY